MKQLERERRTPEDDDEYEARRQARIEREIDFGDYLRDERKDREMEDRYHPRECQP